MHLSEFDFTYPEDLVAHRPAEPRDSSRLMLPWHEQPHQWRFQDLPKLVTGNELFVFNNTRVLPCRLFAHRLTGARVEIFVLQHVPRTTRWTCLVQPAAKLRDGESVELAGAGDGKRVTLWRSMTVDAGDVGRIWQVDFDMPAEDVRALLRREGHMPLPPYIHREDRAEDREWYQTVFAEVEGAVAAPTASLHFTRPLLEQLRARGCAFETVTLHVGLGTFLPIKTERVEEHRMHGEDYEMTEITARHLERAASNGREVICVGTTAMRAVESALESGVLRGETRAYFHPEAPPRFVRSLITNFHQPRSTLFLLICSLLGREKALSMYQDAFQQRYRLFSYGDGMWIRRTN